MAKRTKTRNITIKESDGTFYSIFKRFRGEKKEYDFSGISALRQLLSNEKARLLHVIKNQNPESIYHLAKILGRDFKSVRDDIKLLERFGFLDLVQETKGKREKLKPVIAIDEVNIIVSI